MPDTQPSPKQVNPSEALFTGKHASQGDEFRVSRAKFDEIGRGSNRPRTCPAIAKIKIDANLNPLPGRFISTVFSTFVTYAFTVRSCQCSDDSDCRSDHVVA